jgi:hypothetical protein
VPKPVRLVDAMEDATLSPFGMFRRMLSRKRAQASPAAGGPSGQELVSLLFRLLRSQTPWHRQADEPVPRFADEWLAEHARGRDVVDWYGDARAGAARSDRMRSQP